MKKIINSILVLNLILFMSNYVSSQEMNIRKPAVAGNFYPDEKNKLINEVKKYLSQVPDIKLEGEVIALIVPHAGYIFSGQVAAYAYKIIKDKPKKTVILIGPSHHYRYNGISIFPQGFYETPLGQVRINEEVADRLIASSNVIKFNRLAHFTEHSLEVQLPFLQEIWGNEFTIVPLLLGSHNWEIVQTLKEVILENLPKESFILIASSDMSHYHNYEEAKAIDMETLRLVKNYDTRGLYEKIEADECEWCGAGAVLAVMEMAKELGADKVKILKYANSGDTAPPWLKDENKVVGYSAIVFYRSKNKENNKKEDQRLLNKEEQKKLLEIARISIENAVQGKKIPEFTDVNDNLKKLGGVFVTLNRKGRLRGCIGFPEAVLPLYQAVSQAAISAALKDYRFPPVSQNELSDIEIEISVLSPLEKITDINKIEVGKHGLVIRKGFYSGLLLPQVATEYGWDRVEFLERICEKAGLPRGAWRSDAELYIFVAQIFHEEKR